MKRITVIILSFLVFATLFIPSGPVLAVNAQPNVVPNFQQWTGGTGNFTLLTGKCICVASAYSTQLMDTANVFKEDLSSLTGYVFTVATTDSPAQEIFTLL